MFVIFGNGLARAGNCSCKDLVRICEGSDNDRVGVWSGFCLVMVL